MLLLIYYVYTFSEYNRQASSSKDSAWMGDRRDQLNSTRARVGHVASQSEEDGRIAEDLPGASPFYLGCTGCSTRIV